MRSWDYALEVAVVSCGAIAVIQCILGGSGIRYVANSGLESNGDDRLVLLDHLDWPAVDVDEEEGLFKTLTPVILVLLVVIMVVLLRLKLKRGA